MDSLNVHTRTAVNSKMKALLSELLFYHQNFIMPIFTRGQVASCIVHHGILKVIIFTQKAQEWSVKTSKPLTSEANATNLSIHPSILCFWITTYNQPHILSVMVPSCNRTLHSAKLQTLRWQILLGCLQNPEILTRWLISLRTPPLPTPLTWLNKNKEIRFLEVDKHQSKVCSDDDNFMLNVARQGFVWGGVCVFICLTRIDLGTSSLPLPAFPQSYPSSYVELSYHGSGNDDFLLPTSPH